MKLSALTMVLLIFVSSCGSLGPTERDKIIDSLDVGWAQRERAERLQKEKDEYSRYVEASRNWRPLPENPYWYEGCGGGGLGPKGCEDHK
jgi:hypothetical protein